MKKITFLSKWVLITGSIITITGIIHNAFAPLMYQQILNDQAIKDKAPQLIYFFIFSGTAILFAGLLTIYSSFALKETEKWSLVIAISSGIFVAIGNITAITFAGFGNPLIYIGFICAISNVLLLLIFSKAFKVTK